jgi:hypothetical protein
VGEFKPDSSASAGGGGHSDVSDAEWFGVDSTVGGPLKSVRDGSRRVSCGDAGARGGLFTAPSSRTVSYVAATAPQDAQRKARPSVVWSAGSIAPQFAHRFSGQDGMWSHWRFAKDQPDGGCSAEIP